MKFKSFFFTYSLSIIVSFFIFGFLHSMSMPLATDNKKDTKTSLSTKKNDASVKKTEVTETVGQEFDVSKYGQEWDDVKGKLDTIENEELDVLRKLRDLDEQVERAVDESSSARSLGTDILNSKNEDVANNNLQKLKDSLGKIKEIQDNINKNYIAKIDDSLKNIQSKVDTVNTNVSSLKKKGENLHVSEKDEDQKPLETKPVNNNNKSEAKKTIPQKTKKTLGSSSPASTQKMTIASTALLYLKEAGNLVITTCGKIGKWIDSVVKKNDSTSDQKSNSKSLSEKKTSTGVSTWRIVAKEVFDKVSDFSVLAYKKTKESLISIYNYFAKGEKEAKVSDHKKIDSIVPVDTSIKTEKVKDIGAPEEMGPVSKNMSGKPPTLKNEKIVNKTQTPDLDVSKKEVVPVKK